MSFPAALLTPGIKPTKYFPSRLFTNLGRNVNPRKSKLTQDSPFCGSSLTIYDPGLRRVEFQLAFLESLFKGFFQRKRLRFRATMDNAIIGIAAERQSRIVPLHPGIKHPVEEEVSQDGADYPALGRPFRPRNQCAVVFLKRRLQPPLDVQKKPPVLGVPCVPFSSEARNRFIE